MFCADVNIYPPYFNASKIHGDNSNCDTKTTMLYSIVVFVSLNKGFFMKQAQTRQMVLYAHLYSFPVCHARAARESCVSCQCHRQIVEKS